MDLLIISFIILMALFRTPLYIILLAITFYLFFIYDEILSSILISFIDLSNKSILVAIPLFTLAGFILSESKTPERLIKLANSFFGFLPGGLGIVSLLICAMFTAFTGASGVTIIALGGLLYPMLIKQKYPEKFSLGLMTTSGSLGLLFAPSLPIIIYGIVSNTNITHLFKAGIVPGILLILILAIYSVYTGKKANIERSEFPLDNFKAIQARLFSKNSVNLLLSLLGLFILYQAYLDTYIADFINFILIVALVVIFIREFVRVTMKDHVNAIFNESIWEVSLPVFILSGIYSGVFSPTESASVTVIYVIIMVCFKYKDLDFIKDLPTVSKESMILVSAILVIMASALAFTNFLVTEEIPDMILEFIQDNIESKYMFLLALNLLLFAVGSVMDIYSAILIVVPLIIPIAAEYDIDSVHLGIIFLTNLEIGYMTPPVGLNLFIASFRFEKNILVLYRSSLVYIGLLVIALIAITYIPALSLFWI